MIRSLIGVSVVVLGGLFAYYYFTDSSGKSGAEKAKAAAERVGDNVVDHTVAGAVRAKLASDFGVEAARFLHVYFDEGTIVVYGLAPQAVSPESIRSKVAAVPGVKTTVVRVLPRPAEMTSPSGLAAPAGG
jgi:hypothetical protein